jgi:ABC-type multidrug transport system permease subunit
LSRQTATAVLLTAWFFVTLELLNGLPPTWAWIAAVAAVVAAIAAIITAAGEHSLWLFPRGVA